MLSFERTKKLEFGDEESLDRDEEVKSPIKNIVLYEQEEDFQHQQISTIIEENMESQYSITNDDWKKENTVLIIIFYHILPYYYYLSSFSTLILRKGLAFSI